MSERVSWAAVALCWVPVMPALARAPDAFACFVEVGLLLSGPLVAVSAVGTAWRRVSPCSSTVALVVGHVPGTLVPVTMAYVRA